MRTLALIPGLLLASALLNQPSHAQTQEGKAPCSDVGVVELCYGDHAVCTISAPSDIDLYRFAGEAGDRVLVVVSGMTNNLDVRFELLDPSGTSILTKWCTAGTTVPCSVGEEFELPISGLYTLLVSDQGANNTGDYALNLERIAPPFPYRFAQFGVPSPTVLGHRSDHDFLAFAGAAGDLVRVAVSGQTNNLDVAYKLYGPSGGQPLASGFCTAGTTVPCSVTSENILLEEDGMHWLMVYDNGWNNTGNLSVTVTCVFGTCPPGPELLGTSYCATNPNSTGNSASTIAWGSPWASDGMLFLYASDVPPKTMGLFFYGPNQAAAPLGDGVRCVGNPVFRFPPVSSCNRGELRFQPSFGDLPGGQSFLPGSTWNFQAWFRDGLTSNTSDGLEITFQ